MLHKSPTCWYAAFEELFQTASHYSDISLKKSVNRHLICLILSQNQVCKQPHVALKHRRKQHCQPAAAVHSVEVEAEQTCEIICWKTPRIWDKHVFNLRQSSASSKYVMTFVHFITWRHHNKDSASCNKCEVAAAGFSQTPPPFGRSRRLKSGSFRTATCTCS